MLVVLTHVALSKPFLLLMLPSPHPLPLPILSPSFCYKLSYCSPSPRFSPHYCNPTSPSPCPSAAAPADPQCFVVQGTAATEAAEFFDVYNLNVVEVPSRLPDQRVDHSCRMYVDRWAKLISLYQIVLEAHAQDRPVLIGTSSVEESEQVEGLLMGLSAGYLDTNPTDGSFSRFWVGSSLYDDKTYTHKKRRRDTE